MVRFDGDMEKTGMKRTKQKCLRFLLHHIRVVSFFGGPSFDIVVNDLKEDERQEVQLSAQQFSLMNVFNVLLANTSPLNALRD